jgi:hypothetical protein
MGGIFSQPKMPPQPDPVRMPVENSPATRAAAVKKKNDLLASRGRASTNLADDNQLLGQ